MEYISTTSLSNELDIPANELFAKLKNLAWIDRKNDKWILTELGKQKGGQTRTNSKFGEYIVWPENISFDNNQQIKDKPQFLNATTIGKHYNISSQRLNLILSELGWIEKDLAGWVITKLGKTVGGKQYEHDTSGNCYVLWPTNILQNRGLNEVFKVSQPDIETPEISPIHQEQTVAQPASNNFRDKFEAKHRTKDGHFVRSRAEVIIDDTLYDYGLVHAYEKKVPIEEELYTDFYLPNGKVYIEYWGLENDPKYAERKKKKIEIYKKYDLKLIELTDDDILNLDDHLPKKLLKYGIKVY
ncbi:MAG TPA: hypothetical protein VK705_07970 [Ferruginibacter sp.]|jgi:hypothetical protein|nr:hypothetical protein [Ferruginibacter sp.]